MEPIGFSVFIFILIVLYFVPLIVALLRNHKQIGMVAVINIFLGWTLIFWVVALAIACSHSERRR